MRNLTQVEGMSLEVLRQGIDWQFESVADYLTFIERRGTGFRVHYAIADVASFVRPGGALDLETHRRGVTLYSPDLRTSLHPPVLSEGAASLLPDVVRPAVLWRIDLDSAGQQVEVDVERALVPLPSPLSSSYYYVCFVYHVVYPPFLHFFFRLQGPVVIRGGGYCAGRHIHPVGAQQELPDASDHSVGSAGLVGTPTKLGSGNVLN